MNSEPPANRDHLDRRSGRDRRSIPRPATAPPLNLLLAKLVAIIIGAFVGLLAANMISQVFVTPFQEQIQYAREIVDQAQDELLEVEPELTKVRADYLPLEAKWAEWHRLNQSEEINGEGPETGNIPEPVVELESTVPAPENSGTPAAGIETQAEPTPPEPEVQVDDTPALDFDLAAFHEKRERYTTLRNKKQRLENSVVYWSDEIRAYRQNIDLLNLLGIGILLLFTLLGYLLYPLTLRLIERTGQRVAVLSEGYDHRATQGIIGFFAGLTLAIIIILIAFNLFNPESSFLTYSWFKLLFGSFVAITLGITGSLVAVTYFGPPRERDPFREFKMEAPPKILDTSVIIDGRVHEIGITGFLGGLLVVTNSVLRELQLMADSADDRKRSKGRRGLELVRKMQDDPRLNVRVFDDSAYDSQAKGTDEQLIIVAQAMNGMVVTNDFNLNRVAAIRDVRVININALANAVKSNHQVGDHIDIKIIEKGKQRGQGVGYLDDGTMVVIEDGEPAINQWKTVQITSVSQTVQGRLLFGRIDLVEAD